jgi:hypothetical protein
MTEIEFGELPPSRGTEGNRPRTDHQTIAGQLKANPKQWACILKSVSAGSLSNIKAGSVVAYRPVDAFQVVSRNTRIENNRRVVDVWARYVGSAS